MINDDKIIAALNTMKHDIENTMVKNDLNNWSYHITIYSKNDVGLIYASYLMKILGIKTNFIGLIPITYKYCAFDCVTVVTIFNDIYDRNNINTEGISILECDTMENDDFYILITKDSRFDKEKNVIMAYRTLHEYYK